jgi:hypothetical protein
MPRILLSPPRLNTSKAFRFRETATVQICGAVDVFDGFVFCAEVVSHGWSAMFAGLGFKTASEFCHSRAIFHTQLMAESMGCW